MARGFGSAAKVGLTFRTGTLQDFLEDSADIFVTHELEKIADLAVQEVESIIRQVFINDRSGRRRKERTQHLLGSIRATVTHGGRLAELTVWSTADAQKVGMLEYGTTKIYTIVPRDAEKGFLYFPSNLSARPKTSNPSPGFNSFRRSTYTQYRRKPGLGARGELLTKTVGAEHGPYTGKHFMRRGAMNAIRKGFRA